MPYSADYAAARERLESVINSNAWYSDAAHVARTALVELSAYDDARRAAMADGRLDEFDKTTPRSVVGERAASALRFESEGHSGNDEKIDRLPWWYPK